MCKLIFNDVPYTTRTSWKSKVQIEMTEIDFRLENMFELGKYD